MSKQLTLFPYCQSFYIVVILLQQKGQHISDLYLGRNRACALVLRVLRELERKGALIANDLVLLHSHYNAETQHD
jgi:hypothetical protein